MNISEEILANHSKLSLTSAKFIEFAVHNTEALSKQMVPVALFPYADYKYNYHNWPTFMGGMAMDDFKQASIALPNLIKKVLQVAFDNDPQKILDFYKPEQVDLNLMRLFLNEPNGLSANLCRTDYILTSKGFKCLELNMSNQLGGWEDIFFQDWIKEQAFFRDFRKAMGSRFERRDPLTYMLAHSIRNTMEQGLFNDDCFNLGVIMPMKRMHRTFKPIFEAQFRQACLIAGLEKGATVQICTFDDLEEKRCRIYAAGKRLHALFFYTNDRYSEKLFRAFKAGGIAFYNGPLKNFLNDKRNLALVAKHLDSPYFNDRDRDTIEKFIPWTRPLIKSETSFEGRDLVIPDDLYKNRDLFVIKSGKGLGGADVVLGKFVTPETWKLAIEHALSNGQWLVQEKLDSLQFYYQSGDYGLLPHDVVWGGFGFGPYYGGGLVRALPSGAGDGIINSSRNAIESTIFEVL